MNAKEYLEQYMAMSEEIIQIEHELGELASKPTHLATDCVFASPAHEPYQNRPIPIQGNIQSKNAQKALQKLVKHYDEQLERLYHDRDEAERIISGISDSKARTIIRYRYIDGMEWPDVAAKMGHGVTIEGIKKYAYRHLEKIL